MAGLRGHGADVRLHPDFIRKGKEGESQEAVSWRSAGRCIPLRSMAVAFCPAKFGLGRGGSSCCKWCYLPENRCQGCGKESRGIRKEAEGDAGTGRV